MADQDLQDILSDVREARLETLDQASAVPPAPTEPDGGDADFSEDLDTANSAPTAPTTPEPQSAPAPDALPFEIPTTTTGDVDFERLSGMLTRDTIKGLSKEQAAALVLNLAKGDPKSVLWRQEHHSRKLTQLSDEKRVVEALKAQYEQALAQLQSGQVPAARIPGQSPVVPPPGTPSQGVIPSYAAELLADADPQVQTLFAGTFGEIAQLRQIVTDVVGTLQQQRQMTEAERNAQIEAEVNVLSSEYPDHFAREDVQSAVAGIMLTEHQRTGRMPTVRDAYYHLRSLAGFPAQAQQQVAALPTPPSSPTPVVPNRPGPAAPMKESRGPIPVDGMLADITRDIASIRAQQRR